MVDHAADPSWGREYTTYDAFIEALSDVCGKLVDFIRKSVAADEDHPGRCHLLLH